MSDTVTLVIQHDVRRDATAPYESWLKDIAQEGQRFPGHLGVNVIRPHGATTPYTVVLRFDSHDHLRDWVESDVRRRLIERARPLLRSQESLEIQTGLEYWFTPPTAKPMRARPYKQFLITLSAIFPLTLLVPWVLQPLIAAVPWLQWPPARAFVCAVLIVFLMVYLIMPRYTRAVAAWLFE